MMQKTYLVTGCAGFIGSKVCELLLAHGHDVVGIDTLNDAYDTRLKEWRLHQLTLRPRFSFHHIDICDRPGLRQLFYHTPLAAGSVDGVINLAARAGVRQSVENPWVYIETNVIGTLNLLELCREVGVNKFVLSSSSSLYGSSSAMPFSEEIHTHCPLSPYAATKKAAEVLCYTYHRLYGIDVTVLRYFTVYGPAGRPDMAPFRFVQWIAEGRPVAVFGDGKQSRDFTYVDDIADGTVRALRSLGYEIINLGSDTPIALMDVIRIMEGFLDRSALVEYKPGNPADVPKTWADITKAKRLLDWQPQTAFNEGIGRLVQWYEQNRQWAREIATE